MKQILHIFRKDARHHWPEILISLVLLGLYTWRQPFEWTFYDRSIFPLSRLFPFLTVFLLLSWIFLAFRVVHSESLVGNRQFWLTRPYRWYFLLASKFLFLVAFIHLPLLLCQIYLLHLAHFPVLPSLFNLLILQCMLFLVLVLPAITIASVTSGFGQGIIALLIVVICFVGIGLFQEFLTRLAFTSSKLDLLQGSIALCSMISVIVLQFAQRRTPRSRLILTTAFVSVVILIFISSAEPLIRSDYPTTSSNRPLPAEFSFDHTLSFEHHRDPSGSMYTDDVTVQLPFRIDNIRPNTVMSLRAMKLTFDLPVGESSNTKWQGLSHSIAGDRNHDWPSYVLGKHFFEKYAARPLHAHATLALDVYGLTPASTITVTKNQFRLPQNVRCHRSYLSEDFRCFGPTHGPGSIALMANLPNASCPASADGKQEAYSSSPAIFTNPGSDSDPEFDLSPVQVTTLEMLRYSLNEDSTSQVPICNGTSLFLANARPLYAVRVELDLGEIVLQDYLPGYPAKIVPTPARPLHHVPSDTLSQNNPLPFPAADDSAAN